MGAAPRTLPANPDTIPRHGIPDMTFCPGDDVSAAESVRSRSGRALRRSTSSAITRRLQGRTRIRTTCSGTTFFAHSLGNAQAVVWSAVPSSTAR